MPTNYIQHFRSWRVTKAKQLSDFVKNSKRTVRSTYFNDWNGYLYMAIVGLAYAFSHKWLWEQFNVRLVNGVLEGLHFEALNLFWLLIFLSALFVPAFIQLKKIWSNAYKPRLFNLFLLLFGIWLYWWHREGYSHYGLYEASLHTKLLKTVNFGASLHLPISPMLTVLGPKPIGFFDPFLLVAIAFGVVMLVNTFRFGYFDEAENVLTQDIPIEELALDKLERKAYFSPLIEELAKVSFDSKRAFAIGINSSWGNGKSSLLEIMKGEFKKKWKDTVYMEYNPWMSSAKNGLTADFFAQFDDLLSGYIETDNLIIKYGRALSKIDSDKNPLKVIGGMLEGESPLKERHERVGLLIKNTNKRFVVVIDDMDRLDSSEVFEVLRLIRNTANFSRILFVAAYDKNYLLGALESIKTHDPRKYLEKIFDIEVSLPKISTRNLKAIIGEIFNKQTARYGLSVSEKTGLDTLFSKMIFADSNSQDRKLNVVSANIWGILRNKRQVIRFTNSLLLTYQLNRDWLYLPDLMILELIKLIDHNVYLELSVPQDYLEQLPSSSGTIYKLFTGQSVLGPSSARLLGLATMRHDVCQGKGEVIAALINALFQAPSPGSQNGEKSIIYVEYFENYFIFAKNAAVSTATVNNLLHIQ